MPSKLRGIQTMHAHVSSNWYVGMCRHVVCHPLLPTDVARHAGAMQAKVWDVSIHISKKQRAVQQSACGGQRTAANCVLCSTDGRHKSS